MKIVIFLSCILTVLPALSKSYSRQHFDKTKDLLLANFDLKPDEDDVMAAAAFGCLLQHEDFKGVNYYVVAGAYGVQEHAFVEIAVPGYYNQLFGKENKTWTNAHKNWEASVKEAAKKVLNTLKSGGKVFVAEAGQSDFTYDVCQVLLQKGVSESAIKTRIIIVQHSDWNENKTTQSKLTWLKENTDYNKIEDGNKTNGTPNYKDGDTKWLKRAKAADNPNKFTKQAWTEASRICNEWKASWDNEVISAGGVDFSDVVEFWWIFELGDKANTISDLWNRYVINLSTENNF